MYEKAHSYPKVLKWTQVWLPPDQLLDPARLPFEHNSTDKVKNWKQRVQERKQWKEIIEQAKTHKELQS
jgi:hypothetical protein